MEEALTIAGKVIAVAILFVVGLALRRWTYRNVHGYRNSTAKEDKRRRKRKEREQRRRWKKQLRDFDKISKQVNK